MRVYHFLRTEFGLMAIRNRRLKASTLNELNDPFEMLGVVLSDKKLRLAMARTKKQLSQTRGLHCFSKNWTNPVLWSHYAASHRGMCLGFDIPDEQLLEVSYISDRLSHDALFDGCERAREEFMKKLLGTKFSHWKYEDEARLFVSLDEKDRSTGFYYTKFSKDLRLAQVIIGAESKTTRREIADVLGDLAGAVDAFKVRPAFKSFNVVKNRNKKLWK